MQDPRELFTLAADAPELDAGAAPPLVVLLSGFVDAGHALRLTHEQLGGGEQPPRLLASFDVDQLLDYRSRRPPMTFVQDHWESYEEPRLALWRRDDARGRPMLYLHGPEPDFQWERFVAGVELLMDHFGSPLSIGLNAIPMAVPHTRPVGVTAHANRRELIRGYSPWVASVEVPGSAAHLLEWRRAQAGRDAMGFAAHVPHYLVQVDYPAASRALLDAVEGATGLNLPTPDIDEQITATRAAIDAQVAGSEEVAAVVRALEESYDAFVAQRGSDDQLAEAAGLPSADELGADIERFLAEQAGDT